MTGLPWDEEGDEPGTWIPDWEPEDWPEYLSGPEYWLWKKQQDGEDPNGPSETKG